MKDAAFSLLRDLTEAHGAPGHEDGPRAIFAREMAPLGTLTTDRLGSVLCELSPGTKNTQTQPRVMITAHLDEVADHALSVRWSDGIQNPLDESFEYLMRLLLDGIEARVKKARRRS